MVVTLVEGQKAGSAASLIFFFQFLALNRVELASRQSSHRIITFIDQLSLALQTIAAKTDGGSMI